MSVRIRRVKSTLRGFSRYSIRFSDGMPIEFMVQSPPKPQTRRWKVLFARALSGAAMALANYHEEQPVGKR